MFSQIYTHSQRCYYLMNKFIKEHDKYFTFHFPIITILSLPSVLLADFFLMTLKVHAHLRKISASGVTPVKDRSSGSDRKPVSPACHPLITLHKQVTAG